MRAFRVGALVVAWSTAVHAEPTTADPHTPYALAWVRDDGAESCPAGRDFADEVTRRLGRSPFDARADRAIEIRVAREGAAYVSHVVVRERDGRVTGQRTLSSPNDCGALFSATALAVALLIDPDATLQADARATEAVAQFEVPEPKPAPAAPPPPAPAPRADEHPPAPAASTASAPPSEVETGSASVRAVLGLGVVPGVAPGAELSVSKRLFDRVSAGVSALYIAPGNSTSNGVTVDVGVTAFNLSALVALVDTPEFVAGAEAGAWLGALHTSVETTTTPGGVPLVPTHPGDLLYASVDAGLHARLRLLPGLLLEARALALVPLVRRRLEIVAAPGTGGETPPNSEVWIQPAIGGMGSLGLGVPFP